MAPWGPKAHLETLFRPAAPSWLNIGPWRAMVYPKVSISVALAPHWRHWALPGRPFGTPGHPLWYPGAPLWYPGTPLWHPLDTPWRPPLPSWDRVSKKIKKIAIVSYLFGLFSGRVRMHFDHAGAVQTHIGQLFLTLVFKPRKNCKDRIEPGCSAAPVAGS